MTLGRPLQSQVFTLARCLIGFLSDLHQVHVFSPCKTPKQGSATFKPLFHQVITLRAYARLRQFRPSGCVVLGPGLLFAPPLSMQLNKQVEASFDVRACR